MSMSRPSSSRFSSTQKISHLRVPSGSLKFQYAFTPTNAQSKHLASTQQSLLATSRVTKTARSNHHVRQQSWGPQQSMTHVASQKNTMASTHHDNDSYTQYQKQHRRQKTHMLPPTQMNLNQDSNYLDHSKRQYMYPAENNLEFETFDVNQDIVEHQLRAEVMDLREKTKHMDVQRLTRDLESFQQRFDQINIKMKQREADGQQILVMQKQKIETLKGNLKTYREKFEKTVDNGVAMESKLNKYKKMDNMISTAMDDAGGGTRNINTNNHSVQKELDQLKQDFQKEKMTRDENRIRQKDLSHKDLRSHKDVVQLQMLVSTQKQQVKEDKSKLDGLISQNSDVEQKYVKANFQQTNEQKMFKEYSNDVTMLREDIECVGDLNKNHIEFATNLEQQMKSILHERKTLEARELDVSQRFERRKRELDLLEYGIREAENDRDGVKGHFDNLIKSRDTMYQQKRKILDLNKEIQNELDSFIRLDDSVTDKLVLRNKQYGEQLDQAHMDRDLVQKQTMYTHIQGVKNDYAILNPDQKHIGGYLQKSPYPHHNNISSKSKMPDFQQIANSFTFDENQRQESNQKNGDFKKLLTSLRPQNLEDSPSPQLLRVLDDPDTEYMEYRQQINKYKR